MVMFTLPARKVPVALILTNVTPFLDPDPVKLLDVVPLLDVPVNPLAPPNCPETGTPKTVTAPVLELYVNVMVCVPVVKRRVGSNPDVSEVTVKVPVYVVVVVVDPEPPPDPLPDPLELPELLELVVEPVGLL